MAFSEIPFKDKLGLVSATMAFVGLLSGSATIGYRFYTTEKMVYNHEELLGGIKQNIDKLTDAALVETAEKQAKQSLCKSLIRKGEVEVGKCDDGRDEISRREQ